MSELRVRLRPDIAAIAPYRQGRMAPEDAFKLSSNENPYPPLPAVVEAVASSPINRYPEGSALGLRVRLAEIWGVTPDEVYVGNGSASIIADLVTATSGPGDEVVFAWKSFEAYPGLTASAGATGVRVPTLPDGRHDIPGLIAAVTDRTKLLILCSPNNPTSTVITREEFDTVMASVPRDLLVVLDEAYVEFVTDPNAVNGRDVLPLHPNLIVLRTFSKAYGLAGLRIGYGIAAQYITDALRTVQVPLGITDLAQRAAIASLDHEEELLERVRVISERRDRFRAALLEQGWEVPEAQGNFVWLTIGERNAEVAAYLEANGLVVRANVDGLRITVGEEETIDLLLRSLGNVIAALRSGEPLAG